MQRILIPRSLTLKTLEARGDKTLRRANSLFRVIRSYAGDIATGVPWSVYIFMFFLMNEMLLFQGRRS